MLDVTRTERKTFRMAAPRMFVFLAGVGYPGFVIAMLAKYGLRIDWQPFLLGAACLIPTTVILAGAVSALFPISLTAEGIYAQSSWGLPSFVRWQDIEAARHFTLLNLRWLRIYSRADKTVTWLPMFQSPELEFKLDMERLAPPDSPVLEHLE